MKKICPPTKGVAIRNYLLREHLSNSCIIDKRDSWTDYLALWIWFTSTVAVCIPATSIDALPRIRLILFMVLGAHLLSIILSLCGVLQTKQSISETRILNILIILFCQRHILVDPNNRLLSLTADSICLFVQYRIL